MQSPQKTDIILEVIYKMSLSPAFKIDQIQEYVDKLNYAYAEIIGSKNSNNLIYKILDYGEFSDIIPYKSPFPEHLKLTYRQIAIPADGNCLFYCFLYLKEWKKKWKGDANKHHENTRAEICKKLPVVIEKLKNIYLKNNPVTTIDDFTSNEIGLSYFTLMESSNTDDNYITNMCRVGTYGTDIEILTAILLTNQDIKLYYSETDSQGNKQLVLLNTFELLKDYLKSNKFITINSTIPPLTIYHHHIHYDLFEPIKSDDPPDEIERRDIEEILKKAELLLTGTNTRTHIILDLIKKAKSTAKPKMQSLTLSKEYICIPNLNGQFPSRLDCESDTVSIKQDPAQLKTEVINEVLNQIISKLYKDFGDDFWSYQSLIDTYEHKLQKLYDEKLKLYTGYDYLDFKSFMDILKEDDFFKDKIILVETHPLPYAYKYMKYKMKYLTLKNNTYYNIF